MEATGIAGADARRFYGYTSPDGCVCLLVARDVTHALELLADIDEHPHPSSVKPLTEAQARARRIRSDDDSPADNLADAPMGALYSSEV